MFTISYKTGYVQCYIDRDACKVMLPLAGGGWRIENCKSQRAAKARITRSMKS